MSESIRTLWGEQARDAAALSSDTLEARARLLDRKLRRRDRIEYLAGGFAIAVFAASAIAIPLWSIRAGCLAMILGILIVLRNLWVRRPAARPTHGETVSDHYRSRLVQQRDMLASVWRWYLGPFVPGMLLFFAAVAWEAAQQMPTGAALGGMAMPLLPVVAIFWLIARLNKSAALRLQAEIDAIDRAGSGE